MYNNLKEKSILYIEDDETVLKNISKLLGNYFAKIHTAADGKLGYEQFVNQDVDLIIVDIELPKLNGIELIKKIRKLDENIPIVVISAYTKTDYLLESVELNLDKYIVKPFTSKKLHSLLKKLDDSFLGGDVFELVTNSYVNRAFSTIEVDGESFSLTSKELEFLVTLHQKGSVTYDNIDLLWLDEPPSPDAIRSFIKTLRKKLPDGILKNRQNLGYYIEK